MIFELFTILWNDGGWYKVSVGEAQVGSTRGGLFLLEKSAIDNWYFDLCYIKLIKELVE